MIRYDLAHTVMVPDKCGKWVKYADVVKMVKKEQAKYLRCSHPSLAFAYAQKLDACNVILKVLEAKGKK